MLKTLPPVVMKKGLEMEVYQKIEQYFNDLLFSYIEAVLSDNVIYNSKGLVTALLHGKITYSSGVFSSKNKIPSNLAKEIEKLGGKWSKSAKGYKIGQKKLPMDILQAIAQVNIHNEEKLEKINKYLDEVQENLPYIEENVKFESEVNGIMKNLETQLTKSLNTINIIAPKLTDFQVKEISKNYTNNLDYYIKKWTKREIVKLREDLQPFVMKGYRADAIEDMIQKHKNISKKKAKFLARQETELLVAEYRKNRFKQAGITRYRWSTVLDGRERPLHRELNGKIFSWDEPPIIDDNTGEKGNPGEAYNCRCIAMPVIDTDIFRI